MFGKLPLAALPSGHAPDALRHAAPARTERQKRLVRRIDATAILLVWAAFACLSLFVQPNYDDSSAAELLYYSVYNVAIGWLVGFRLFDRLADDGYALFALRAFAAIVAGTLVNEAVVEPTVFGLWHINGEGVYFGLKDALSSAGIFLLLRLARLHLLRNVADSEGGEIQQPPGRTDADAKAFLVRVTGGTRRICASDVLYMEAERDFTRIVCSNGEHFVSESLKSLIDRSSELGLVRVHKSFAVNLGRVDGLARGEVELGARRVPVGRRYRAAFVERWRSCSTFVAGQ